MGYFPLELTHLHGSVFCIYTVIRNLEEMILKQDRVLNALTTFIEGFF